MGERYPGGSRIVDDETLTWPWSGWRFNNSGDASIVSKDPMPQDCEPHTVQDDVRAAQQLARGPAGLQARDPLSAAGVQIAPANHLGVSQRLKNSLVGYFEAGEQLALSFKGFRRPARTSWRTGASEGTERTG